MVDSPFYEKIKKKEKEVKVKFAMIFEFTPFLFFITFFIVLCLSLSQLVTGTTSIYLSA